MAVPTIALYASPPGNVCSTPPHPFVPSSSDYDFNSRPCSSSSPASTQRSLGGLSCLFSANSAMRHAASTSYSGGGGVEEFNSIWHDRGDELSSSYSYSSSIKCCNSRDQSPVSVFQGPVSSTSLGITSSSSSSSRSSPMKISHSAAANSHHHSFTSIWPSRQGLLNGFVRNALGSFIDNDSVPLHRAGIQGDSSAAVLDEFTFNMEESFAQENWTRQPCAKKLLFAAQSKHKIFHDEVIVKAFYEAEKAHRGQMRASGDPYLQHCVQTAILLAAIGANCTVVAAGLLHDTLDDSFTSYDYILKTFGGGVADLVEGVSKLSHLSKLARENNTASKTTEADRLHTMFLAMADARAVLIKLADRLHNMMTLGALPLVKQQRFAKETMEIFVPLANRLGISTWKEQLESLCFKYLNPDQHEKLSSKLEKSFNEARITSAKENLGQALKDGAVSYHVLSGRHKSLYSIYCKMTKYAPYAVPVLIVLLHLMSLLQWSVTSNRKNLTMDQIHDIHGLRLIVENEEDCYSALKVVHQLWPEAPGKFKDYIQHPKLNGYQSLHTVVMGEDMAPLEIQIRTKDMHLQAEFGFAAHWRYKEGDCTYSSFVLQMVEWARWVVTWQCEAMSKDSISSIGNGGSIRPPCPFPWHSDDCPYSYTPQSNHNGPVYVVLIENEKMSVQEFPPHATVMDLLEKVGRGSSRWSHYRFPLKQELRPTLNHEPVNDPHRKLKMGDVVHLTPSIPDESLSQYREEIQRMYDRGLTRSGATHGRRWRN